VGLGVGAEAAALAVDNTDVFKLMTGTLNENTAGKPAGKAAGKAGKTTEESKAKKPRKAA